MATSVAPPRTGRSALGIFFKIVLALVLLAALAAAGGFAWFYRAAHASLAQLDGTIAVPGLTGPVAVIRDGHGVPHLTAASLEDLSFAQGYITAQDRLWQMDITRRAGAGELSEILGAVKLPSPPARSSGTPRPTTTLVDYDKTQRFLRLRAVAERVAAQLPERDKMIFSAYTRGVNAYIDQHRDHLPIEFHILRYQPRAWSVADSVLVGISMSQLLNPQYGMEYWREKIGQKLSPELMADLYPFSSPRDHPPGQDSTSAPGWQREQIEEIIDAVPPSDRQRSRAPAYPSADSCEACLPGSNN